MRSISASRPHQMTDLATGAWPFVALRRVHDRQGTLPAAAEPHSVGTVSLHPRHCGRASACTTSMSGRIPGGLRAQAGKSDQPVLSTRRRDDVTVCWPAIMSSVSGQAKIRVGIVGCGDVAHRWYLPALASLREVVEITACCDAGTGKAERATAAVADWSPSATPYTDLDRMLADARLDAAFNLTPAPAHGGVTRSVLEAGLHVYSEKPIASSLAEADELIELARESGRHLLCAPAVAVTRRFRWLGEIVASDRFGRLTLAVTHHADPGPAAWREYTGDPTVFYGSGVGPLVDHGIYRLHGLTMLMGAVRRVQAMGSIGSPTRVVRGGPLAGRTIDVTTPDHMLINLEFGSGAIGQLLASFGTPATQAPMARAAFRARHHQLRVGLPVRPARGAQHLRR